MSIHVTVNGNPVCLNRRSILLADIEKVKKNEWLRRRKIRLQQARQQAKDLAQNVRQKVSSERSSFEKHEQEKDFNNESKKKKEKLDSLQREYEQCLSSVGSGHHLASLQNECDALLKEKEELREEIARARGALAEERLKVEKCLQREKSLATTGRKQLTRKVEDLRSTLISSLPSVRSTRPSEKTITVKAHVHQGEEEEKQTVKTASEKPSTSKGTVIEKTSIPSGSPGKKSSLTDCEDFSEESDDDSDVTWPPRSARVIKEPIPTPRVRFYDHSTRTTKEFPKPSYSVTLADPFNQPDMSEAIAEEEEACVRKENLDVLARREKMIRGNRALRKERDQKDAEKIIKEIDDLEKRRKIQMINNKSYPSHFHSREDLIDHQREMKYGKPLSCKEDRAVIFEESTVRKEPIPKMSQSSYSKNIESEWEQRMSAHGRNFIGKTGNVESEELLADLIQKLKEERAKKQKALENRFGVTGLEEADIPLWVSESYLKEGGQHLRTGHSPQPSRSSPEKMAPSEEQLRRSPLEQDIRSPDPQRKSVEVQTLPGLTKCPCSTKCNCFQEVQTEPSFQDEVNQSLQSDEDNLIEETLKDNTINEEVAQHNENKRGDHLEFIENGSLEEGKMGKSPNTLKERSPDTLPSLSQETVSSSTDSTSQAETVESSLTYEGVKVVVKVSEKNRKRKLKSPIKMQKRDKDVQTSLQDSSTKRNSNFVNGGNSTSTSYLSPPSRLSPAQQSLLCSMLKKIETRTKNPRLHSYIKRLLDMNRESLEKLPVSSVSDISISSSIFEKSVQNLKHEDVEKCDVCCQAGSSLDESNNKEALKFSELAKCYADRVNDLAVMIDALRILPSRGRPSNGDETSYLNPPDNICHSVKLSNSVQAGSYPSPIDISDIPISIRPHPNNLQPQAHNGFLRKAADDMPHYLSTIEEAVTAVEKEPLVPPGMFDPDVSSIRGTPQKKRKGENDRGSTGSSLCLLDDKDISSFIGSSSDDFEDVFRSLGIAWALPTVRKTRESRKLSCNSSTSSGHVMYSHSTPLGQSPAKESIHVAGPSSAKQGQSNKSNKVVDTDSLTPPSFSLNIPRLSQYLSPPSANKHK